MSTLGVVHTVFSFLAILFGALVVLLDKGTRWHRTWGHLYAVCMLGLAVSALFIYRLTGTFGPFHIFAIVALVTLSLGMGTVLLRRPRTNWMEAHATWMSWSYVGLLAAFAAESLTRFVMPLMATTLAERGLWGAFWGLVGIASFTVAGTGGWIIRRTLPRALASAPEAMRRERVELRDDQRRASGEPAGDQSLGDAHQHQVPSQDLEP